MEHLREATEATITFLIILVAACAIGWGVMAIIMTKVDSWSKRAKRRANFVSNREIRAMNITPQLPKDWK